MMRKFTYNVHPKYEKKLLVNTMKMKWNKKIYQYNLWSLLCRTIILQKKL